MSDPCTIAQHHSINNQYEAKNAIILAVYTPNTYKQNSDLPHQRDVVDGQQDVGALAEASVQVACLVRQIASVANQTHLGRYIQQQKMHVRLHL